MKKQLHKKILSEVINIHWSSNTSKFLFHSNVPVLKIFSFPTKEDCSWVERKEILSVVDYWVMDKRQVYLFSATLPVTEKCDKY